MKYQKLFKADFSNAPFSISCSKMPLHFSLKASLNSLIAGVINCLLGQMSQSSVDRGWYFGMTLTTLSDNKFQSHQLNNNLSSDWIAG